MLQPMIEPEAYWRSPWRAPVGRMAQQQDRAHIGQRVEAALRRFGAPIAYEVFDRSFVLCESTLPRLAGEPDIGILLADATGDRFAVGVRERGAIKELAVHDLLRTALGDFLARSIEGQRDLTAIARWIMGQDAAPPPG